MIIFNDIWKKGGVRVMIMMINDDHNEGEWGGSYDDIFFRWWDFGGIIRPKWNHFIIGGQPVKKCDICSM